MLSPDAQRLNFAISVFFSALLRVAQHTGFLDGIHFGCGAKEEMLCTHSGGIVGEELHVPQFNSHESMIVILCVDMFLCIQFVYASLRS